eukprot:21589-Heterococcus_DN1.PRE.2
MQQARYAFAARFVAAAKEGRNVVTADDIYSVHALESVARHNAYHKCLLACILVHMALPFWECSFNWPLMLLRIGLVAVYILHVILHALVFGKGYFRDKYWESIFAILAAVQAIVLVWSSIVHARHSNDEQACDILRISETARPYLLISQMATLRRVFTNVLRTMYSTKEHSATAVYETHHQLLGVGLFNKGQVTGYDEHNDNFESFMPALLSLYVLTTEENFPFVADPALAQRPLVAHTRVKARRALLVAYNIIDDDGVRGVNEYDFKSVMRLAPGNLSEHQIDYIWCKLLESAKAPETDVLRVQDFLNLARYLNNPVVVVEEDLLHTLIPADEDAEYIDINSSANDDNDSDSTTTSRVYTSKKPKSTFYTRLHVWAVHVTATNAFRKAVQANTLLLAVLSVTWTAHRQLLYFLCTVGPDALLAANSSNSTVTTTTVSGSVNSTMHELTPQQQHVQNSIHRGIAADESCTVYLLLHMAEGLLLILFAVEIWLKIVAKGTKNYLRASRWHWFDLFIASSSLVAFTATTTGVFAARYILNHKLTMFSTIMRPYKNMGTLQIVQPSLILMLDACVHDMRFAIAGVALFSDVDTVGAEIDPRYSFATMRQAMLAMAFLTVTNNWNDLLYPVIVQKGRWAALYFAAYMLFCSTIILDVLISVVIEGFRVAAANELENADANAGVYGGGKYNPPSRDATARDRLLVRMTSDGNMNTKGNNSTSSSTRNSSGRNGRDSTRSSAATTPEKQLNDDTNTSKSNSGNKYDSARSCSPSPQRQQAVTRALRQEDMFKIGLEEEGISEDEIQHLDTMVKVIEKRLHEQWSRNVAKAQQSTTNSSSSSTAAVADNSNSPNRDAATATATVATTTAATVTPRGSNSLKPCSSTDNILAPTTDNSHHSDSYGAV